MDLLKNKSQYKELSEGYLPLNICKKLRYVAVQSLLLQSIVVVVVCCSEIINYIFKYPCQDFSYLLFAKFYRMLIFTSPYTYYSQQTGYSFGFGFVEYQKPEDAAKAILQLNNLPVQHKRIKVSYARPPGEDIKETNLYIQNIPR